MPRKIGVFGHYGNENLGDEAITTAVIQNIRRRFPDAEIIAFSINPHDTEMRHGVPAFAIRHSGETTGIGSTPQGRKAREDNPVAQVDGIKPGFRGSLKRIPGLQRAVGLVRRLLAAPHELASELGFLRRSRRRLKGTDLLIVAGSNQFLDNFGGPTGFPYTLLKWTLLARSLGTKVAYISVGAGPLDSIWSKRQIRFALRSVDFLSYRDEASRNLVEGNGFRVRGTVCPDLAHDVKWTRDETVVFRKNGEAGKPVVGINPMPVYDRRYWYIKDDAKYSEYVGKLARFASRLVEEGYPLFFWTTQTKDQNVARDVFEHMTEQAKERVDTKQVFRFPASVDQLLSTIESADLVVATRFHGTVLSILAQRPVLGVCYYRKARDLLDAVGQERFHVMLDDFSVDELYERFKELEQNKDAVVADLGRWDATYQARLCQQYDHVLSCVETDGYCVG